MRVIKFRAWDTSEKEMVYNNFQIDPEDGTVKDCYSETTLENYMLLEKYILMQFTGLLDKHGKEVFGGDIIKCSLACPHKVEWYKAVGGIYGGGLPGWGLSGLLKGFGSGYAWTGKEEIIGNIYENPELMQKVE